MSFHLTTSKIVCVFCTLTDNTPQHQHSVKTYTTNPPHNLEGQEGGEEPQGDMEKQKEIELYPLIIKYVNVYRTVLIVNS